jgi:hypothetical protein
MTSGLVVATLRPWASPRRRPPRSSTRHRTPSTACVCKGALAKPVKHQHGGLQLEGVEAASLQRYRPSRRHPYWCRTREAASILGLSATRVQQLAAEGRFPYVEHAGIRLYRRPQVEVIANAREARRLA